jgi:hypothetical protein
MPRLPTDALRPRRAISSRELRTRLLRATVPWAACLVLGCSGTIGDVDDTPRDPSRPDGPGGTTGTIDVPRRLLLLEPRHFARSVEDVLELAPGSVPAPESGGGVTTALYAGGTDRMTGGLALEVQEIVEAASQRAAEAMACEATECVEAIVLGRARRAFRRALEPEERDGLLAIVDEGTREEGSPRAGARWAFETILQSPSFLYRRELGSMEREGFALDPYETATWLGYFLRDAGPDEELLAAAAEGRLESEADVRRQVDRLLEDDRVRENVAETYLRLFDLPRLAAATRTDPALTDALRESMRMETVRFVDRVLWRGSRTLGELLTSSTTEIDGALAEHYGLPRHEGVIEVDLGPERSGFLTHASWLTGHADVEDTSVVHRGIFVSRHLLCLEIPPPPAGVLEDAADALAALDSERARAEYRMDSEVCGSCHAGIDPFGLAFEGFDELGRTQVRDTTTTIAAPPTLAGAAEGARELATRLAESQEVADCVASQIAGAALGRALEARERHVLARELRDVWTSDDLVALVRALAELPSLRRRVEVEP